MTADPRLALLRHTSESALQEHALTLAARGGYHGFHIRNQHRGVLEAVHSPQRAWPRCADHDDAFGLPDLWLIRGTELHAIELKRIGERPRPDQRRWQDWLNAVTSVQAHVFTPADEREMERLLLG